jgi:Ni/Fe-hydrogenase subunit HybB-like protein
MDLSFVALGAGSFVTAGLIFLFGRKEFEPMARVAILIGLAADIGTTFVLLADLGRPDRFYHPLIYWNVRSLLWVITWCVILYVTVLMFELIPVLLDSRFFKFWPKAKQIGESFHHNIGPFIAIFGVVIGLIHQPSIGAAYSIVKGNPIWGNNLMPVLFLITALVSGPSLLIGVTAATSWAMNKHLVPKTLLQKMAVMVGILIGFCLVIRVWDVAARQYFSHTPLLIQQWNLLNSQTPYTLALTLGEFVIGGVIPALIYLNPRTNHRWGNLVIAAVCTTIGLLLCRWDATLGGVGVSVSYSPSNPSVWLDPYFPAVTEWMVVIGVVAFAGIIYSLGVKLLPIFTDYKQSQVA